MSEEDSIYLKRVYPAKRAFVARFVEDVADPLRFNQGNFYDGINPKLLVDLGSEVAELMAPVGGDVSRSSKIYAAFALVEKTQELARHMTAGHRELLTRNASSKGLTFEDEVLGEFCSTVSKFVSQTDLPSLGREQTRHRGRG